MTFEPGHQLATGRPKGSKNKLGREFDQAFEESKARGYTHPFLRMMEIAFDETQPTERRDMMLLKCADIACPKAGTIQHQFVAEVQRPTSIEQAEELFLQLIADCAAELDPLQLSTLVKHWIESKRAGAELHHKLNPPETKPQLIQIVGGLPPAPGMEGVIMPDMANGHPSAQMIEGKNSQPSTNRVPSEPVTDINPTPGELKAVGPHPLQERHFRSEPEPGNSGNGGQEP